MNMFKMFALVGLFRDVTSEVEKAGLEKRPWYLQRSFFGALVALAGGGAAAYAGVTLDKDTLNGLSDNLTQLSTVIATLYGASLSIYGLFKKATKPDVPVTP